ncbi:MAG TPA: hypothetical protein VFJ03_00620 [Candidatus Limnocylindria bacterium]|nr:hypothetical protein [Candidatus Limnocylindria bacterium]
MRATIEARERSIAELVRDRQLAQARGSRVRWQLATRQAARQPNGQRGL